MKLSTSSSVVSLLLLSLSKLAAASPFTAGNILVTEGSQADHPRRILEYSRTGTLVQTLTVPSIPGQTIDDTLFGTVVDNSGNLHVVNGLSTCGISNYNATTGIWSTVNIPGMVVTGYMSGGGLALSGNSLFFSKNSGVANSLVKYDIPTGTYTSFGVSDEQPLDISIGPGGFIYALEGVGSPSGRSINVYDPSSLALSRTISLNSIAFGNNGGLVRTLLVRPDGKIWANQLYNPMFLVDNNGVLQNSYYPAHSNQMVDFDQAADGTIAMSGIDGHVYLYDQNLNSLSDFDATNYYYSESHVSFVPSAVPEPSVVAVISLGVLVFCRRRKQAN